ncbi:MAG: class I SAM-dependent methyltransferase, partial [Alphaproteobacteria bacterium]|nr:class I SAM-dependent methyltransferase [Alphaproteobacteria bacterium]
HCVDPVHANHRLIDKSGYFMGEAQMTNHKAAATTSLAPPASSFHGPAHLAANRNIAGDEGQFVKVVSRLESAIRRLQAQKICLDWAAAKIASLPGPVLEFGLGNGRTYDHLRQCLSGRGIFVFERQIASHPDCLPDSRHLLLGDIRETLPDALIRIGAQAVLAHYDIGNGDKADTAELAAVVGPALAPLLACGALVVSSQALAIPGCSEMPLPEGVAPGRYYIYRMGHTTLR